jgi:L-fuconolactonase
MKIDAHQHFWQYSAKEYSWIDDNMKKIKKDFLPDDLYPLINDLGIDGTIAVQARQTLEETQWLLELSDQYDLIKGVVGWVNLSHRDLPMHLDRFVKHSKFIGVRHVIHDEPDDNFMLNPEFMNGIKELSNYDLSFDILIFSKHLQITVDFIERFPNQRFVLDHLGKPLIKDQVLSPWKEQIQQLAEFPNVYCKLSGMITEADWNNWNPADFHPYLDTVFEYFGTKRILTGSDWPVCMLAGTYSQVYDIILKYLEPYSNEDCDRILGNNALNFYKI